MLKQTKKEKILKSALSVAENLPWEEVTVKHILEKAEISLDDFNEYFEDKMDVVGFWHHKLDQAMLSGSDNSDTDIETKDFLFDVMMERFDALNENREASLSILCSFKKDPKETVFCFPYLGRSMQKIAKAAGLPSAGLKGAAVLSGLCLVYIRVLYIWVQDDSADMGKTMAGLDKTLKQAGYFAQYLGL